MNQNKLYREIGLLDDDLIMEAEIIQKPNPNRIKWKKGALAACLAVIIMGSVFLPRLLEAPFFQQLGNSVTTPEGDQYALTFNDASSHAADIYIPGHFWQALTKEERKAVLPGLEEGYQVSATANYRGDGTLFNIEAHAQTESGAPVYLQLAPGEPVLDYSFGTDPVLSQINGVPVLAGCFEGNTQMIYFAEFKLGEVGYYIEMEGGKEEKALLPAMIDEIICGGAADFSVLDPVIPELREDKLTLDEAYADKAFGAYLPQKPPSGFAFESSVRFINQESDYLSAFWYKGMSDIRWMVSKLSESDAARITSVAETKNYDLSLYPIPMADSVPLELREIVDNPIFLIDDLTLEAVQARSYMVDDAGDESGYRMRFSVLYDDDILVEVIAQGAEPTYIFEQLNQIKNQ